MRTSCQLLALWDQDSPEPSGETGKKARSVFLLPWQRLVSPSPGDFGHLPWGLGHHTRCPGRGKCGCHLGSGAVHTAHAQESCPVRASALRPRGTGAEQGTVASGVGGPRPTTQGLTCTRPCSAATQTQPTHPLHGHLASRRLGVGPAPVSGARAEDIRPAHISG